MVDLSRLSIISGDHCMFQLHISVYVSIISIVTTRITLFCNYEFVSHISFTSVLLKFLDCFRKNNYRLGIPAAVYLY